MPIKQDAIPDQDLRDYLLGKLGDASERVDELSVCDDAFSHRLEAAENDLVDAYVRGQMHGQERQQFEAHYMSTEMRRKKVHVARALSLAATSAGFGADAQCSVITRRQAVKPRQSLWSRLTSIWQNPRSRWATACALLASFVVSTAWLSISNYRLRVENRSAGEAFDAAEKRLRQLEEQARNQARPRDETHASGTYLGVDATIPLTQVSSLYLPPPLRGVGRVAAVSLTGSDKWLQLELGLEANDFRRYRVDLKDLGRQLFIWRNALAESSSLKHRPVVRVWVPAETLKHSGSYSADVRGIAANGQSELLGVYVFRVAKNGTGRTEGQ